MATQYATISDLDDHGIAAGAFTSLTDAEKDDALMRASEEADGYIGNSYKLPLTAWGRDLTARVVDIAVYHLLSRRGFAPGDRDTTGDAIVVKRYDDALRWLRDVGSGRAVLLTPDAVDATASTYEGGAYLVTRAKRGW